MECLEKSVARMQVGGSGASLGMDATMSEDLNEVVYEFHEMLYDRLLYYGHADAVVRTRSPYVKRFLAAGGSREPFSDRPDGSPREKWMNRAGDFVDHEQLLWEHFHEQGSYDQAILTMLELARGNDGPSLHRPLLPPRRDDDGLPKLSREKALQNAHLSATAARRAAQRERDSDDMRAYLLDIEELQMCAEIQKRLLVKLEQRGALDSSEGRAFLRQMRRAFSDQMLSSRYLEEKNYLATKEMLHRLGHSLDMGVTELYDLTRGIPTGYNLWEEGLFILKALAHDNEREVKICWHQLCMQCMPRNYRTDDGMVFMNLLVWDVPGFRRGRTRYNDDIVPDVLDECALPIGDPARTFEDGDWLDGLRRKVVAVGRPLYEQRDSARGASNSLVFPLEHLVHKLEEITAWVRDTSDPYWGEPSWGTPWPCPEAWVVSAMREVGIPFDDLYVAYTRLVDHVMQQPHHNFKLQAFFSFVCLVEEWVGFVEHSAASNDRTERARFVTLVTSTLNAHLTNIEAEAQGLEPRRNPSDGFRRMKGRLDQKIRAIRARPGIFGN